MCCEGLRNSLLEIDRAICMSESHAHSEKGVRIEIKRPANTRIFKVIVDGCVIEDAPHHSKADCLFCICPEENYCIAELKGAGDVPKALEQLKETYLFLKTRLSLNEANTKLVYVSRSVPQGANRKVDKLKEEIKKKISITPQHVKSHTVLSL